MSLIPQFKTELQYIPTVKACLKLSQVDCFCLRLKGSRGPAGGGVALPESCTREKREKREKRERKKGEREKEKL